MTTHFPETRLTLQARQQAREHVLEDMLEWYICNAPAGQDPELCEDYKSYRGKVLRWLEPMLPGLANPVMVEEFQGDRWLIRTEPYAEAIKVFT